MRATVDGTAVQAALTVSPEGYPYVTLDRCGTVALALTYADAGTPPADPDQPPESPPDQPAPPDEPVPLTVSLRAGPNGSLRLLTRDPQAGSRVRAAVSPDRGYVLDP